MSKFSYKNLNTKEQLRIDLIGYAAVLIFYFIPIPGLDDGVGDRFLRLAVYLGPFYLAFQFFKLLRNK
ncbi:hypothetical protein NBRC116594_12040 [Shimia sp. NS0008-38b]